MTEEKKKKVKFNEKIENEVISLRKFLILYFGVNIELNECKLAHRDIISLFPQLKTVDELEVQKNFDMILKGKILCVEDSYKEKLYYVKPNEIIYDELSTIKISKDKNKNIIISDDMDLYELVKVYRELLRANNKRYNEAHKLIKKKRKEKIKSLKKIEEDSYD